MTKGFYLRKRKKRTGVGECKGQIKNGFQNIFKSLKNHISNTKRFHLFGKPFQSGIKFY